LLMAASVGGSSMIHTRSRTTKIGHVVLLLCMWLLASNVATAAQSHPPIQVTGITPAAASPLPPDALSPDAFPPVAPASSASTSTGTLTTPTAGVFKALGTFTGIGGNIASMVGPGPAGTQRYYLTYLYYLNRFDLVAIDPSNIANPQVYHSPLSTESGAYALTVGPDNNMYLGTEPDGHLMVFNTQTEQLTDLGAFPPDPAGQTPQSYIWQLTVSPYNQQIYGCTYPSGDLVSYDPLDAHPQLVNLGSVDPTHTEQYARHCLADPNPNNPYIYIGAGAMSTEVIAYNIVTQQTSVLLSNSDPGFGAVYLATDGNVYGTVSSGQYSKLLDGVAYSGYSSMTPAPTNVFSNGDSINVSSQPATVTLTQNGVPTTYPYHYAGGAMDVFRLALGPNGTLYGSSVLPAYLLRSSATVGGITSVGYIGGGELYSLASYHGNMYMGGYYSVSYGTYNPAQAFNLGANPAENTSLELDLRSQAMIASPIDRKIYLGSIGGYGQLTGSLIVCDPNNVNNVTTYQPIPDQSIVSLAATRNIVVGATSIYGGAGTEPATTAASLFTWDPQKEQVIHSTSVPNTTLFTDLITAPNGYVYALGFAAGYLLMMINPQTLQIVRTVPFPYTPIYNSVAIGPDGNIWGLATNGIFKITVRGATPIVHLVASPPVTITGGFALADRSIYFAADNTIYAYTQP